MLGRRGGVVLGMLADRRVTVPHIREPVVLLHNHTSSFLLILSCMACILCYCTISFPNVPFHRLSPSAHIRFFTTYLQGVQSQNSNVIPALAFTSLPICRVKFAHTALLIFADRHTTSSSHVALPLESLVSSRMRLDFQGRAKLL